MQEAALWLAVMNLGSFRSPFVPDAYGLNVWMVWRSLPSPRLRLRPVPHGVAPAEA